MEALEPIIIHVIVLVTSCSIAGTKGTFYLFSHFFVYLLSWRNVLEKYLKNVCLIC